MGAMCMMGAIRNRCLPDGSVPHCLRAVVAVAIAASVVLWSLPPVVISSQAVPRIAIGAFIDADGQYAPSNPHVLDWYAGLVGRMPAVVMWYQDWVHWPGFPAGQMD